jgi:hypothetical protein
MATAAGFFAVGGLRIGRSATARHIDDELSKLIGIARPFDA